MAAERVVWYLWANSLALAIPNNSGQSDRRLVMWYVLRPTCKYLHCSTVATLSEGAQRQFTCATMYTHTGGDTGGYCWHMYVGPCLEAKLSLDAAKPRLTVQPGATVYSSSCPIRTGMTAPSMYVPHWILYLPGDTYYKTLHVADAVPLGRACVHLCFYTRSVIMPRGSVDMKGSRLVVRHKGQTPFCKGLLCNPNFLLLCGNCVTSVVWQKCCSQFMNPITPTAELYQGLLPGDH